MSVGCLAKSTGERMSFCIKITPRKNATGAIAHAVIVSIDDHKTVLTFESKEDAEAFAHVELARLVESGKHAERS
jgi:hypothetical protein